MCKQPLSDVKLLVLKRWNTPQPHALFEENTEKYGDYVSFRSHHFIDVINVPYEKDGRSLSSAYHMLSDLRKAYKPRDQQHTHIVQTMPLLGWKSAFWNRNAEVLYITFIQLTNVSAISYEALNAAIAAYLKQNAPAAEFSLYQSLDFCDFVLFTKNITLEQQQNLLWGFTLTGEVGPNVVRDTFTIFSFGWDYLSCCFSGKSHTKWNDTIATTINLGIQSLTVTTLLEEKLLKEGIKYHAARIGGRYDYTVVTEPIDGEAVMRLLATVDQLAHSDNRKKPLVSGYEVIMTVPSKDALTEPMAFEQLTRDWDFNQAAISCLDRCTTLSKNDSAQKHVIDKIQTYIIETICSLKELLNNGFADEFVLCVLPSFLYFINISEEYGNICDKLILAGSDNLKDNEQIRSTQKSLQEMWRQYLYALNTLSLCTMHSERQFIQAPSFNASYFEIPPKLLAYYNSIVAEIVKTLKPDNQHETYRFVLAPDFRDDINVIPLPIHKQCEDSKHLAIINLNESFIYEPVKAIMLFAHEAAHYVGSREREMRAECIFKAIGLKLLMQTPVVNLLNMSKLKIEKDDVFSLLADAYGSFLYEYYQDNSAQNTEIFYSNSIASFLKRCDYGLALLANTEIRNNLAQKMSEALAEQVANNPLMWKQFLRGLKGIEKTFNTDYYSAIFARDSGEKAPYWVFAQKVALFLYELNEDLEDKANTETFEIIWRYIDEVVHSFTEAYADYRMFEICGKQRFLTNNTVYKFYNELLDKLSGVEALQRDLRYHALYRLLTSRRKTVSSNYPYGGLFENTIVELICNYIKSCEKLHQPKKTIQEAIQVFSSSDLQQQYMHISNTIQEYRADLTKECKNILGN